MFRFELIMQSYARYNTLFKITCVVLLFSILIGNIVHFLEPDTFPTIFDGVWWAVVTISTVGYGDFAPESTLGRLLGILLIVAGIALFSFFITNLASSTILAKQEREQGGMNYKKKDHYIIVGWNERTRNLISQLQNLHKQIDIVLVDETLQKIPSEISHHFFVKGSPTMDETFVRANIKEAHTVIITANLHIDEKVADSNTVLTLLTVKGMKQTIYTIVELVTPKQRKNAERAGADEIIQSSNYLSLLMTNGILFHGMTDVISQILKQRKVDHLQLEQLPRHLINENFQFAIEECQTEDSFLMGIRRDGKTLLHPSKNSRLLKGDQLIFFNRN